MDHPHHHVWSCWNTYWQFPQHRKDVCSSNGNGWKQRNTTDISHEATRNKVCINDCLPLSTHSPPLILLINQYWPRFILLNELQKSPWSALDWTTVNAFSSPSWCCNGIIDTWTMRSDSRPLVVSRLEIAHSVVQQASLSFVQKTGRPNAMSSNSQGCGHVNHKSLVIHPRHNNQHPNLVEQILWMKPGTTSRATVSRTWLFSQNVWTSHGLLRMQKTA